ncbi:MAG: mechanosensitive ion channel family protein [Tannerella sp.]|jgi:small-conductance mechanosensitive channel|nr:mechanosensitive ion channel family protein [Tannerella sp.]
MDIKDYLLQTVASVIVLILLPFLKLLARKLISKYGKLVQIQDVRIKQMKQVISILMNFTFIFIIAIIWGVKPNNILLGLSSIFAIIGVAMFAQWSMLSNITAGIIMFFTAPFRIGDRIHIIDKDIPIVATIESIQTFYTHIRTEEKELIVIPNNLFLQKIVSIKKNTQN